MTTLPPATYQHNMRLLAQSDQGGRPDGVQLMVHRGFGYVGHIFSRGFSVIDLRDPRNPKTVAYIPAPQEVGACVPPPPTKMVDPRPNRAAVLHSADVHVDVNGIVYCTDFNAGLSVKAFSG